MKTRIMKDYRIGHFYSVPLYVHGSTFVFSLVLFLSILFTSGILKGLIFTGIILPLVFSSIALHEYGHIFAASFFGISARGITFYPFGGIAQMKHETKNALEEFAVAAGGPLANFVLAALLFPFLYITPLSFYNPLCVLFGINLFLGLFNLIPAYPMDGGRILRGVLWHFLGRRKATRIAAFIGQVFAIIIILIALIKFYLVLLIVGCLVFGQARREYLLAEYYPRLWGGSIDGSQSR